MRTTRSSVRILGWSAALLLLAFGAGCAADHALDGDGEHAAPVAADHDAEAPHGGDGDAAHDADTDASHDGDGDAAHDAETDAAHDGDRDAAHEDDSDGDAGHGDHGDMAAGELQRYPIRGVVLAVDPTKPGLIVAHGDIEGFMGGMTMNFAVDDPAVLEGFEGNETIEATLVFDGENGWLEDIEIVETDEESDQE